MFTDLQSKGYVIGQGERYGGDYCLYKDDPTKSHSSATVRIISDDNVSYTVL